MANADTSTITSAAQEPQTSQTPDAATPPAQSNRRKRGDGPSRPRPAPRPLHILYVPVKGDDGNYTGEMELRAVTRDVSAVLDMVDSDRDVRRLTIKDVK